MSDLASVRAQRDDLYQFIVRRTRDPAAADDLVQETFARLLTYERAKTITNRAALGYSIALNLVRDHFRSRKRRPVEALLCSAVTAILDARLAPAWRAQQLAGAPLDEIGACELALGLRA